MKRVTFAIAAYNHGRFVREALESVWNDSYPAKEIVIIDDGSTDNTEEVIRVWCTEKQWKNIRFFTQPNAGITATLNRLISSATGDYIRLVASDDALLPHGTEEMVNVLNSEPEAMAVFGDAALIDGEGNTIAESVLLSNGARKARMSNPTELPFEIITNWSVSGPVVLIRKDFYSQFGLYDTSLLVDDWDLYLRLSAMKGLRFIDQSVAKYRIHGTNTSKTADVAKRLKNLSSQHQVAIKNIPLFQQEKHRDLLRSEQCLLKAKIAYLSKEWGNCSRYLVTFGLWRMRSMLRA